MDELMERASEKTKKVLERIKEIRKKERYSYREIAEKLGIDTSTYSRIENGEVKLKLEIFIAIAEILGVTETFLLFGDE